tara:strand:+ start:121 stop:294 length:174 start_codon:yes stop_codon:yes gene_type:complete
MAVVLGIASLALVPHSASLYGRTRPHVAAARMAITLEDEVDEAALLAPPRFPSSPTI